MRKSFAALFCMVLPVIGATPPVAEAAAPAPHGAPPLSNMDALFLEIVDEARLIDRTLSQVTDKETADRSVELLEHMLIHMDEQLHALEQFSFRREQDAEALKAHMATLTHISQSYLATMRRLAEVNAYGSETLLALFIRYKVDGEKLSLLQAEDMPHTQLYGELADAMEDIIYTLSRVKDPAAAAAALPRLQELLSAADRVHLTLVQLVPPSTSEQKDAVRPAKERIQNLFNELKRIIDGLQEARSYGNKELDALLPRLLQTALS